MNFRSIKEALTIEDLNDYQDCFLINGNGENVINNFTGENLLDYDLLKERIVAEKLKAELDISKRKYIEKDTIYNYSAYIQTLLSHSTEMVESKYFTIILAIIESKSNIELDGFEQADLKEALRNTTEELFAEARKKIDKLKELEKETK